jgi:ribosome recycling factor
MIEQLKKARETAKEKMQKCADNLEKELVTIRAGQASPAVLDKIVADYYGVPTPINSLAAISVSEGRTLIIQPWDISSLKAIEKAILASDVGINPTNDGKVIRLVFPQPTAERRQELVKLIHKYTEEAKVAVRNIRRDIIDKLKAQKKSSEITEDDLKEGDKIIQKETDSAVEKLDKICKDKGAEITKV